MRDFRKMLIYQRSYALVKKIYHVTKPLIEHEKYGLYQQIRRSAVSIPSNIAEGAARSSEKEFKRFLEIAIGSAFEVETQLNLIQDLSLIPNDISDIIEEIHEIQKMISSFIYKLKTT